jgi:hypothetical protein
MVSSTSMTGLGQWSVWHALSVINKAFLLLICGVSIYLLSLSLHALFVVRSMKIPAKGKQLDDPRLGILRRRLWHLRQLRLFFLCTFLASAS